MIRFTAMAPGPGYLCIMNTEKITNTDLYYTNDHEWINFQGTVAYTGVCSFKLLGFKEIHQVHFIKPLGFVKKDEVIASIVYNEYRVEVHMPVDGKLAEVNESLLSGNKDSLLVKPESTGWIAKIVPSQPYERNGLLLPKQYQMNGKSKYAK
jgi:glycine cleavage system H protein